MPDHELDVIFTEVLRHFHEQGLRFPRRPRYGPHKGDLLRKPPQHSRALSVLHNPPVGQRQVGSHYLSSICPQSVSREPTTIGFHSPFDLWAAPLAAARHWPASNPTFARIVGQGIGSTRGLLPPRRSTT